MITSSFFPTIGGAESYAMDVSCGLATQGHEVTVATDLPREAKAEQLFSDPPALTVERFSDYLLLLEDPSKIRWEQMAHGLMPELAACVERCKPDLVLTNSLDAAPLGKTVALELDIPWAATFHEHAPEDEPLGRGRLRFVYATLDPSLAIAGSRFYAERARRWNPKVALKLIYHGVDTDTFHPAVNGSAVRAEQGLERGDLLIVCAGRLKPRKGMRDLVAALRLVRERLPQVRLLIVGSISSASADYAAHLEEDIERLRLQDAVTIDRTVTFDRMPAVLAAADVVAQPSWEEGLGLSVLEGMSCGRPVVTTDVAGIREILSDSEAALVVPPRRPEALAEALLSLLESPEERRKLGARGRHHVEERFSRRRMLAETEAALSALLEPQRRQDPADV